MNLDHIPKRKYTETKTPLMRAHKLEKELGEECPQIYIKRDDLLGLTEGGNKTRKLEYLMAHALAGGADTLVTCGAIQSNHCRLTLAAALKEGLKCHLILEERVPGTYNKKASGNNLLFEILGAESITVVEKGTNLKEKMERLASSLKEQGKRPYIIPGGGSNPIGATGYTSCFLEMLEQFKEQEIHPSTIVCTSGSSGTHAGLAAGLLSTGADIRLVGISIMRQQKEQQELVLGLAKKTAQHLRIEKPMPDNFIEVIDNFVGPGYSLPTKEMIEAIKTLARTEGVLLDPVYTGKAFAGFLDLIHKKSFSSKEAVVFLHTGGAPALYAYNDYFFEDR